AIAPTGPELRRQRGKRLPEQNPGKSNSLDYGVEATHEAPGDQKAPDRRLHHVECSGAGLRSLAADGILQIAATHAQQRNPYAKVAQMREHDPKYGFHDTIDSDVERGTEQRLLAKTPRDPAIQAIQRDDQNRQRRIDQLQPGHAGIDD